MLIWFGAGSQFVGLLLLFAGFVTTWHGYGDGRNFLVFVADRARQWIARGFGRIRQRLAIGQLLRRMRQRLRKKDSEPVTGTASGEYGYTGAALNATGTFTAEAEVWPSVVDDPDRFAKAVRDRFGELTSAVQEQARALDDERRARADQQRAREQVEDEIRTELRRVDRKAKGAAIDGLPLEFAGWIFLVTGLIVSTIAAM